MSEVIQELVQLIQQHNGINNKTLLAKIISQHFQLKRDRSVFDCADFAVRFSSAKSVHFSNTVLSLSNLRKYDNRYFIVCVVTPKANHLLLANTTFLKKISHSSHELRVDNIRGSFNGSDIVKEFEGIINAPENFQRLFAIHQSIEFEDNLIRLVETTHNIIPMRVPFDVNEVNHITILTAPHRAISFMGSDNFMTLKEELDTKVQQFRDSILIASLIENVNLRGRVIEYLIAGEDEKLHNKLIVSLASGTKTLPAFKTENQLGDYQRFFENYHTEVDIKTKIMILDSNPKAYNIDKILAFLSQQQSVFLFYFIGIDHYKIINTVLVSMFDEQLIDATLTLKHWAGRNSRGVTQLEGHIIKELILKPESRINVEKAQTFLQRLINL
jgi:hypothetical protein